MKRILAIMLIMVFLVAACTTQSSTETESDVNSDVKAEADAGTETAADTQGTTETGTQESEVTEIFVVAKNWDFDPAQITVAKGDTVRLVIQSIDVDHGFALPEFGVSEYLSPGEEITVEFVADKSGEFTFFCNVYCGTGHGNMRGTLIVE